MEQNDYNKKLRLIVGVFSIILIIIIFYLFDFFKKDRPEKIITPEVYDTGTEVSIYKDVPKSFPKELILNDFIVDYVGEVSDGDSYFLATFSFKVGDSFENIKERYISNLKNLGLLFTSEVDNAEVSVLNVYINEQRYVVSLSYLSSTESMVTIQSNKK